MDFGPVAVERCSRLKAAMAFCPSVCLRFELHWAEVAQRGVQRRSVVPEHAFKRGVFCLSVGLEVHAV